GVIVRLGREWAVSRGKIIERSWRPTPSLLAKPRMLPRGQTGRADGNVSSFVPALTLGAILYNGSHGLHTFPRRGNDQRSRRSIRSSRTSRLDGGGPHRLRVSASGLGRTGCAGDLAIPNGRCEPSSRQDRRRPS